MVGNLVGDIGLVECGAVEFREFVALGRGLLGQCAAGVIIFRLHLQLPDQSKRLLVHFSMVAHHVLREITDFLVFGFLQRLLGGLDIELPRRVGNVCDLRIGRLGRTLRKYWRDQQAKRCKTLLQDPRSI